MNRPVTRPGGLCEALSIKEEIIGRPQVNVEHGLDSDYAEDLVEPIREIQFKLGSCYGKGKSFPLHCHGNAVAVPGHWHGRAMAVQWRCLAFPWQCQRIAMVRRPSLAS